MTTAADSYRAALAAHDAVLSEHRKVQDAYRAREIGDEEFLASAAKVKAANAAFDIAFDAAEQAGVVL